MQARLINQSGDQRTFVVVLDTGDEVMASLKRFVIQESLDAAQFTAIGAFRSAVLGYFDWERKDYRRIPVEEQVEVASFTGDLARGRYERNLSDLNEQLRNGQKVLIDITAAQRNQLDQAMQDAQVKIEESKANIVKPDEEHVIWPFNGEYWRDELGFYRQTITSKCGR